MITLVSHYDWKEVTHTTRFNPVVAVTVHQSCCCCCCCCCCYGTLAQVVAAGLQHAWQHEHDTLGEGPPQSASISLKTNIEVNEHIVGDTVPENWLRWNHATVNWSKADN